MLDKITILGEYLANDPQGTWIGGKEFKPGKVLEVSVDEGTFKNLLIAQENKWFLIKSHNFEEYNSSRGRTELIKAEPVSKVYIEEAPAKVEEINIEAPVETETPETENKAVDRKKRR